MRTYNTIACPISELDEEAVRNFLRANPVFLEDYVMKHVDQDRLERWLIRKTRKLKNKGGKKPAHSLSQENNKQSGKLETGSVFPFALLFNRSGQLNTINSYLFLVENDFPLEIFQILIDRLCRSGR